MSTQDINYEPLDHQPTSSEAFDEITNSSATKILGLVIGFFVLLGSIIFTLIPFVMAVTQVIRDAKPGENTALVLAVIVPIGLAMPVLISVLSFGAYKKVYDQAKRRVISRSFANTNNLISIADSKDIKSEQGRLFRFGHNHEYIDGFRFPGNDGLQLGNVQFVTGYGKNSQVHEVSVMKFSINRRMPHVLLSSRQGVSRNYSGVGPDENNLVLEGDFNKYFDVQVPSGYGQDVLYWLTPELMAILIDRASNFDIEIVDNFVYLYAPRYLSLSRESIKRGVELARFIEAEIEENTDRYVDHRVENAQTLNIVAEQGRRLKRWGWKEIALTILVVVLWFTVIILANVLGEKYG